MGTDAIQVQLIEHDRRIGGHHKRIGAAEVKIADDEKAIAVLQNEVTDIRGDVGEIKDAISKSDEKREAEGAANRKALYTVAAFMATFSLSLCGLIVVLAGHA